MPATKKSMKEKLNQISVSVKEMNFLEIIQNEDSWEEESGTEIILEEACEPEEESYAEERPWCDYSDREAEPHSFGTNSENEEEAISEAGRNVKDSQLVLAEEEEVESEAGRNDTEPKAHSTYFSGYGQREETYPKWEDEMETLFQSHHVPEEEKVSYATKTPILEEFVKKDPDQPSMCPAHTIYALSNPRIFKAGSEQVNQHHSPQKMGPAVEKKTVKRQEGLQLSSLQCTKVPDTFSYSKGTL
ncbi:hypothetical protein Bca4012_020386 [Brassica carinata]